MKREPGVTGVLQVVGIIVVLLGLVCALAGVGLLFEYGLRSGGDIVVGLGLSAMVSGVALFGFGSAIAYLAVIADDLAAVRQRIAPPATAAPPAAPQEPATRVRRVLSDAERDHAIKHDPDGRGATYRGYRITITTVGRRLRFSAIGEDFDSIEEAMARVDRDLS